MQSEKNAQRHQRHFQLAELPIVAKSQFIPNPLKNKPLYKIVNFLSKWIHFIF